MADLKLNSTKNTPTVECIADSCTIKITGNSFPENARKFYSQISEWIQGRINRSSSIKFYVDINYMASSSLISFLDMLKQCEKIFGHENCVLHWNYEEDDDDALKIGQDFSKIVSMQIELLPY